MGEVPKWPLRSEWGIVFKRKFSDCVWTLSSKSWNKSFLCISMPCKWILRYSLPFCGSRPVTDVGNLTRQGIISISPAPALPPNNLPIFVCVVCSELIAPMPGYCSGGIKIGGRESWYLGSLGFIIKWEKAYKIY